MKLMQSVDRKPTDQILQAGLDYLRHPGRKVATIGFSMGGQESLNATLNDPEEASATVMIYGSGVDKIDIKRLEKLKCPVLVITGGEDTGATQAAINFLSNMKEAKRPYEMHSSIRVRTTVMRSHSSVEERITTPRPSAQPGSSSKILLTVT